MMAIPRTMFTTLVVLLFYALNSHGLQVTPNSPCLSKCNTGGGATTESSIVCLDSDYSSSGSGSQFQQCVECELGSTAANPTTGTTDVMWGLFLQALDIACQDPPSPTNPFPVTASSIFNATTIQPPTTSSAGTSGSHRLHGTPLVLAIALPIVFVFLLLVLTCIACFFSARRRRRQMASRGKMRRVHEAWADSPATPRATHFDWEQAAIDMKQMQGTRATQRYSHAPQYSYRDDVGPGTGQIKDHELHEQYFAPIPQLKEPLPAGQDGVEVDKAGDVQYMQHTQQEPPNLLHSPVEKHPPYDIGVAQGEPALGDKKDPNQNWI